MESKIKALLYYIDYSLKCVAYETLMHIDIVYGKGGFAKPESIYGCFLSYAEIIVSHAYRIAMPILLKNARAFRKS